MRSGSPSTETPLTQPARLPDTVPFVDLVRIHAPIRGAILEEVGELLESGAFSNGPPVAEFERVFADFCGTADAVGTGSGLDALRLGLIALGVGRGDEVIVPADTFVATVEAVTQTGARPVLVDITADDYNLDVDATRAAVGPRTGALLPVHLYGQLADMRTLTALARKEGLVVLEDACQAHGASRDGVVPGALTDGAAFSFYPSKNLGAIGDGGALATMRADVARDVRALREHGQTAKYLHELDGYTSRLDTVQAAVLLHKLPLLVRWTADRRRTGALYQQGLEGVGDLVLPRVPQGSDPVWHLYVVQTEDPDSLGAYLRSHGIATGRHYPRPPHLSPAFRGLGYPRGSFPVTEQLAAHCLSLPVFGGITDAEAERVVDEVRAYFNG